MPNLPVARVMWRALPDLTTGVECWITAGGAHHTVLSYDVTAEQMKDWARMMEIEYVHIGADTTVEKLEEQLFLNDLAWKLRYVCSEQAQPLVTGQSPSDHFVFGQGVYLIRFR